TELGTDAVGEHGMGAATEDHDVVRLIPPAGVTHPVLLRLNDAAAEHARAPTMAAAPRWLPTSPAVPSQIRSEGAAAWRIGRCRATRARLVGAIGPVALCSNHSDHVPRSEEHTSELQSRFDLVCRLLLEKKKRRWKDDRVVARR